ncbi:MAG TPA: glutaredoxin family protein [Actinomycetota bacterium]
MSEDRTMPQVLMFSRRNCGLCDKARAIILAERERTPFGFDEVFIDGDDDLEDAHGLRVPVIEIDGVEEFETFVDPARFVYLVGGRRR